MANGSIDEAYVEIRPDLSKFESETERGITTGLKGVDPAVVALIDQLERQFVDLASSITSEFKDVGLNIEQSLGTVDDSVRALATTIDDDLEKVAMQASEDADMMAEKFDVAFREISNDGERTSRQVSEAGSRMGTAWQTALGFMASNAVTNAASRAFNFAKDAVFGFNAQLQNASIAFTTMLGSGQKAQSFLNDLKKFAATTPFEFSDLVRNAQNMIGMGIAAKDVIPDLTALGDAVAGVGGSAEQIDQVTLAFNQMAAKGKLDMGNMEQLMQGGVANALQILADGFHKSTGEMIDMISAGKVTSEQALPMLVKGLEQGTEHVKGLGGMMDKQSHTFTGALSNISDSLNQSLGNVGLPLFNLMSDAAGGLASELGSPQFASFGQKVSNGLQSAITGVKKFFTGIKDNKQAQKIIKNVEGVFKDLIHIVKDDLLPAGKDIVTTFGPLIVEGFATVTTHVKGLMDTITPVFGVVKGFFGFIADHSTTFKALAVGILAVVTAFKLYQLTMGAITLAIRIATLAQIAFDAVMALNPVTIIVIAIGVLIAAITYLWFHSSKFRDFWIGVWNAIWGFMKAVAAWFSGPFVNFFVAIGNWFAGPFLAPFKAIGNWFSGPFLAPFKAIGNWFSGPFVGFFTAIPGRIRGALNSVVSFVGGIKDRVIGAISGAASWLYNVGKDIVSGLRNGISDAWHWVTEKVNSLIDKIPKAVRSLLHIASPSKVMKQLGKFTAQGFSVGIDEETDNVQDAIRRATAPPPPGAMTTNHARTVNVHPGAIVINVNGGDPSQAREAGKQAAQGFMDILTGTGGLMGAGA